MWVSFNVRERLFAIKTPVSAFRLGVASTNGIYAANGRAPQTRLVGWPRCFDATLDRNSTDWTVLHRRVEPAWVTETLLIIRTNQRRLQPEPLAPRCAVFSAAQREPGNSKMRKG